MKSYKYPYAPDKKEYRCICSRCMEEKECIEFEVFNVINNCDEKRVYCRECLTKIIQSWCFKSGWW
jgi:hypothetical protein